MQAAFDRTALDRLIALGHSRGGLTPDDLRRALPIDRMSAEDVALVLIELEEAGIAVDPDEIPLQGGGTPMPAGPMRLPERPRLPEPPTPAPAAPASEPPPAAATASAPDRVAPPPARGGAHRAVVLAGLAALALAVVVLTLWAGRG